MPHRHVHASAKAPPLSERMKSIPGFFGIRLDEMPDYRTMFNSGPVEIRDYPRMVLASISMQARYEDFLQPSFEALANYIFANEIEMTTPVLLAQTGDEWTMSFALPHRFRVKDAPVPSHLGIHLRALQPRRVAAYRYSGNNTEEKMLDASRELGVWLRHHPQFISNGERWWAQYDAPFALPFLKRNEAQVALK